MPPIVPAASTPSSALNAPTGIGSWRLSLPGFSSTMLVLGLSGSLAMLTGGIGCAGVLRVDPILGDGPLSALRYGHGRDLATAMFYLGLALLVAAWVWLGREVLAGRTGDRTVLVCAGTWLMPMLVSPPLFTRDVYAYLAQGAVALHGFDPYTAGPEVLPGRSRTTSTACGRPPDRRTARCFYSWPRA